MLFLVDSTPLWAGLDLLMMFLAVLSALILVSDYTIDAGLFGWEFDDDLGYSHS
ncbi:hypothetical protein NQ315_000617 [Exocentrus adspersus]|uniref:Uncharacterized protein n=1 Tax=Exocentrus adspersus TaxID=1586481 RepID=A0AAV8VN73_9CUCU|nr:hypothetical protein NQ315_000617 [Exocentrus adspersus]